MNVLIAAMFATLLVKLIQCNGCIGPFKLRPQRRALDLKISNIKAVVSSPAFAMLALPMPCFHFITRGTYATIIPLFMATIHILHTVTAHLSVQLLTLTSFVIAVCSHVQVSYYLFGELSCLVLNELQFVAFSYPQASA
jgi:hypothetical protein